MALEREDYRIIHTVEFGGIHITRRASKCVEDAVLLLCDTVVG